MDIDTNTVIVTVALGTTAPDGSVMRPRMSPVGDWAKLTALSNRNPVVRMKGSHARLFACLMYFLQKTVGSGSCSRQGGP